LISRSIGLSSFAPLTGEQFAAALELVSDRSEGDDFARSGLRLLGSDRVLTQFGKAPRGSVLTSSIISVLRRKALRQKLRGLGGIQS
jgi:hypothetical protein